MNVLPENSFIIVGDGLGSQGFWKQGSGTKCL